MPQPVTWRVVWLANGLLTRVSSGGVVSVVVRSFRSPDSRRQHSHSPGRGRAGHRGRSRSRSRSRDRGYGGGYAGGFGGGGLGRGRSRYVVVIGGVAGIVLLLLPLRGTSYCTTLRLSDVFAGPRRPVARVSVAVAARPPAAPWALVCDG